MSQRDGHLLNYIHGLKTLTTMTKLPMVVGLVLMEMVKTDKVSRIQVVTGTMLQ